MAIVPGTPAADNININQFFDLVLPSAGNDTIVDNDANPFSIDLVFGGADKDTFVAGKGLNFFDGGAGEDTVDYKNASAGVSVDLQNGIGLGDGLDILSDVENINGSKFNDTLVGDGGNNKINAGEGDDLVRAGAGNDAVDGGIGKDTLRGGQGEDSLNGGAGDDDLRGGEGKDLLDGGVGKDKMDVSQDDDVVFYNEASESTAAASDLITGFEGGAGGDKIDLSSLDANKNQAGNQAFELVAFDPAKPLEAGEVTSHFDAVSGKTIVEAFDGTNTMHTELDGNVALTQDNFVL